MTDRSDADGGWHVHVSPLPNGWFATNVIFSLIWATTAESVSGMLYIGIGGGDDDELRVR